MNNPRAHESVAAEIDWDRLHAGIEAANIPALLMCLMQMTGDEKWLSEPYAPRRGRGIENNDSGGLDEDTQAKIRSAAFRAISDWLKGKPLALPKPSHAQLAQMLGVSICEPIPSEYGEVIASNMGIAPAVPYRTSRRKKTAIIIGGGISGICAAVQMQKLGIEYTLFEKNSEFGGTWLENRYPGCGVDTPNLTYTFSFQPTDWSKHFPLRDEIENYICSTAKQFGLYERTKFDAKVEKAEWIEQDQQWAVTVGTGEGHTETYCADIIFSAVGILNTPKYPQIPGLESFPGPVIHTCRWPDGIEIEGKRVAVVGNGASAMQVAPAIADSVSRLTVFARSKQWAAPFPHFHEDVHEDVRYLIQLVPLYRDWLEQRLAWMFNDRLYNTLFRDPDWTDPDRSINAVNDRHREFFTDYIRSELGDRQDLLPVVLPEYPPYLKRMLLDNGWFRMLTKPNVECIPERLARVDGDRLFAASGESIEADIIILATGYQATEMLNSYEIIGREGRVLREFWEVDNAAAYLGLMVPGFPNFFTLVGPNAGSGHGGSMMRIMENQVHYSLRTLEQMFQRDADCVEVRSDVYESYREQIDAAHDKLMWTHPGAENWYRNSRGRVVGITPWRHDAYWRMTRTANPDDFIYGYRESN